jgi:integrase
MSLPKVEGVVRPRRKPYIPVVLSRAEIAAILKHLAPPFDLVVKCLYGCGPPLFGCLHLRILCFNFDAEVLTVHDGKGGRDRTVPPPKAILPELRAHLESLKDLHQRDLERGYAGVFLIKARAKKCPQELLGHSDVRTTMICSHAVKSSPPKAARSPLDL